MSNGTSDTFGTASRPENRGLTRLRLLRAGAPEPHACTGCASPVTEAEDLLCPACYAERRGPGRLLRFDPDRRRRTEQRLAGRPCPDCQTADWYVSPRGDATCQTCARRRAATTSTRTDDVRGGAA